MCLKRVSTILFVFFVTILMIGLEKSFSQEEVANKLLEIRERLKTEELSSKVNLDDFDEMTDFVLGKKKEKSDTSWVRNLFVPLVQQKRMETGSDDNGESKEGLKVKGVAIIGKTAFALIGDQIVQEGEIIDGMTVTRIEIDKVTLRENREEKMLYID